MKNTLTTSQLQADWFYLHDLNRAKAVRDLHNSGISIRQIASQLHKPDSSLRRLLEMLDAPAVDGLLFRQGKITGNELVRRSRAAALRRDARHREEIELKRERQALKAADCISKWLLKTRLNGPNREMIVDEVRREFAMREADRSLPASPKIRLPLDEIIRRSRPAPDDSIDIVAWHAQWLCRWSFFAFPDEDIRDDALDLALQKQWGR
jgi:hypothetical protein